LEEKVKEHQVEEKTFQDELSEAKKKYQENEDFLNEKTSRRKVRNIGLLPGN
jgi:vacuolar-type H+-ATPase subunit I/STV1